MVKKMLTALSAALCITALTAAAALPAQAEIPFDDLFPGEALSEESASFAGIPEEVQFYFASGVGGWGTSLFLQQDGSFYGSFHDSDMGDSGDGYPNGTRYVCVFSGSFSEPSKVNEYTYIFRIDQIAYENEPGIVEYADGVRLIYSEPYGLDNAEDFLLYLPGAPLSALPEEFLGWVRYNDLSDTEDTILPMYGLYNENAEEGFSGYCCFNAPYDDAIGGMISTASLQSFRLENQLSYEPYPQAQLNLKSGELYEIWDDCLNGIWAYLKEHLDVEAMDALTAEEISWIKEKEAAVAAAGSEVEGGSIQQLVENSTATSWTKDRVFALYERYGGK